MSFEKMLKSLQEVTILEYFLQRFVDSFNIMNFEVNGYLLLYCHLTAILPIEA